jgi:hypothetical protein
LGDVSIEIRDARDWCPAPGWEKLHLHRERISNLLSGLWGWICEHAKLESLIHAVSPGDEARSSGNPFQGWVSALHAAVVRGVVLICQTAAQHLAGLGAGLTPAGDDLLLGAMYAAWSTHPRYRAKSITEAIAQSAIPLTTSLSAAWLRAGANGEAGSLWHLFLRALVSEDTAAAQEHASRLLAVGHTSGADALAGFMGAFACWETVARQRASHPYVEA